MAASDYSPVTFLKTFDNAFYFQVETTEDLESDSLPDNHQPTNNYWVRSKENKTLLLNQEHFEAENLDSTQLCQPDCHFKIQCPKTGGGEGTRTKAMLYVTTINSEQMVVYCKDNCEVYPKEMKNIADNDSKAIFYMTKLESSASYEFESSEYQGCYLGFKLTEDGSSIVQLVLQPKVQCSPGKLGVVAFMWMPLDALHPHKHDCGPSKPPHGNITPQ